jgi:hypothetical protein
MVEMWSRNVPFLLYATSGGIFLIPFVASVLVLRKRQFLAARFGADTGTRARGRFRGAFAVSARPPQGGGEPFDTGC